MKWFSMILKVLTALIVFMVTTVVFMLITASYLPRLNGANYYDHGCFDGVTNLMMEVGVDKVKVQEVEARKRCAATTLKLREKGYLF